MNMHSKKRALDGLAREREQADLDLTLAGLIRNNRARLSWVAHELRPELVLDLNARYLLAAVRSWQQAQVLPSGLTSPMDEIGDPIDAEEETGDTERPDPTPPPYLSGVFPSFKVLNEWLAETYKDQSDICAATQRYLARLRKIKTRGNMAEAARGFEWLETAKERLAKQLIDYQI